jgi:uncharacterized protein YbbK (DUF523 family)
LAEVVTRKPRIGISACAFSCPVRYNGKALDALAGLGREKSDFEYTPVCPECMAGLGVPRMPIHMTGSGQDVLAGKAKVKNRRGREVTEELIAGSRACLEALERAGVEAVIVREASPSCGVYKARVGKRRQEHIEGSGVFGAMLLEKDWFLIPDGALQSPLKWWDWRRRFHAWLWLRHREIETKADVYETWHVLKFIIQELDRAYADEMGRRLAAMPKRLTRQWIEEWRAEVAEVLRRPSTAPRIKQALWKTYVHHKKRGTLDGVDLHDLSVSSPEVGRNVTSIAESATKLERIGFENDVLFGSSPVIYRDRRRMPPSADTK